MNKIKVWLVFITVSLVVISGMGFSPMLAMSSGPATEGRAAADFTLNDLQGNPVTLSDFRGKKAVLVVFWATWCPYCVQEVSELKKLQGKLGNDELAILAVDIKESESKLNSFVNKQGIKYTILIDRDGSVAERYNVYGIPANFLIDKQGMIRASGSLPKESLIKEVASEVSNQ